MRFSTHDRDQDGSEVTHCAEMYKGGYWYDSCYDSNLNGLYLPRDDAGAQGGIAWNKWSGNGEYRSMKFTEMKIRPKNNSCP